jgi:hypothetical protein
MMKAYNKMYSKGKQIGKAFIVAQKEKDETTNDFKERVNKDNQVWNRKSKNYVVKSVKFGKKYY